MCFLSLLGLIRVGGLLDKICSLTRIITIVVRSNNNSSRSSSSKRRREREGRRKGLVILGLVVWIVIVLFSRKIV